jgi:hypothetical protein
MQMLQTVELQLEQVLAMLNQLEEMQLLMESEMHHHQEELQI